MPDLSKFKKLKAMYDSMGPLFADYEADFGEGGKSESDYFNDKDANDGGQQTVTDLDPQIDEAPAGNDPEKKKRKMSMMSAMLKTKMKGSGY